MTEAIESPPIGPNEAKEIIAGSRGLIAFVGPDGAGKSTIATSIQQQLNEEGIDAVFVEGTNSETWELNDVDRDRLEKMEDFANQSGNPLDKRRLYRLRAVMCYRHLRELKKRRRTIILDSDPIHKWLMWEHLHGEDVDTDSIYNRVQRMSGQDSLPDMLIEVAAGLTEQQEADNIWGRIRDHIDIRSKHDPQNKQEVQQRVRASADAVNDMLDHSFSENVQHHRVLNS